MSSPLFGRFSLRSFSLTVRVSLLLILAVVAPLVITIVGSERILRPTLLSQAAVEMQSDAQGHAQAIDALFIARLQSQQYLGHFRAIQEFLGGDNTYKDQAFAELTAGQSLDTHYSNWTLFDTQGHPRLAYPTIPAPRGKYMIAPRFQSQLNGLNKSLISDVYFDPTTHNAFVDIYTSVASPAKKLLGYARSTLQLTDIWTAVNNETNAAPGSYAMILDGNGIRIAYTNTDTTLTTLPQPLFKSILPISSSLQHRIRDENLYGNDQRPVTTMDDPQLVGGKAEAQQNPILQFKPATQGDNVFQAYRVPCQVVPWTYLVLRPVSVITKAADQQDFALLIIAIIVTILAAIVGILVGRGITRPILRSVASLTKSSQMLKTLAARQQSTSTEQKWIVDSAQVGLNSVQYYAEATNIAAHKLDEIGNGLIKRQAVLNSQQIAQQLNEIISAANYIEKAAGHQEKSSKSLSTAIRITTQVTEQLLNSATSATEAAVQLEEVINQLHSVVGEQ